MTCMWRRPLLLYIAVGMMMLAAVLPAHARKHKEHESQKKHWHHVAPDPAADAGTAGGAVTGGAIGEQQAADAAVPEPQPAPVLVPPITFVDINSGRFNSLDVVLTAASFLEAKVDRLALNASNLDFESGKLEGLTIQMAGGQFQDFRCDQMEIATSGTVNFETASLFNKRVLEFLSPTEAKCKVMISQESLNDFLNSPRLLSRLSTSAKKRVPFLSALAGHDVNFGFNFKEADLKLADNNRVVIKLASKLGLGKLGVNVPIEVDTTLALAEGWVKLNDTQVVTAGQNVPKEMLGQLIARVNSLSQWGTRSDDIKFQFTELTVLPGNNFQLAGTATLNRLRFGRANVSGVSSDRRGGSRVFTQGHGQLKSEPAEENETRDLPPGELSAGDGKFNPEPPRP